MMKNNPISKKIISYICIIFLLLPMFTNISAKADSPAYIKPGVSLLRVRETPGGTIITDGTGNPIYLTGGTRVTVLDTTNSAWYKVTFSYNGTQMTGYVSSTYVVMGELNEGEGQQGQQSSGDNDFENYLTQQGFPESYKPYLRDLHAKYPTWIFTAIQTGIDWNTLVENERNKSGQIKNLVNCTSTYPHYNWRSTEVGYNSNTNTWYPYDGSNWYAASDDLVKYYLDPRNYLYETYIFSFESLSYQQGIQNRTGVESILSGSFMYNKIPKGETIYYSDIIMNAAASSGASPYHLAARMKQEMGVTAGVAATGTSSSYPGIYNYFNIGAYDTPKGSAVNNGLNWASVSGTYGRPWNTVSKAIIGGAEYLSKFYIAKGQDTLYTQKFNVVNQSNLFNHQYMTNVQAPSSEGNSQYKAYYANGLLNSQITFKIPVYLNMPSYAAAKPSDTGTPNDYLASLSVDNYVLTPTFRSTVQDYSIIVDSSVSSVNIKASTVASSSSIYGGGTVQLNEGANIFTISVKSDTGTVRNYKVNIVRSQSSEQPATQQDTTASTEQNTEQSTEQTTQQPVPANVKLGDVNGDGNISALDIISIQRIIVGLDTPSEEVKAAADVNRDSKVSALDIIKVQRHIVGLELIQN